ncbi:hypothetical protein ENBRE01_0520 [Enteropsectra breve]|nr:hypothetical protein ENBRE01_0520 [Enteropsectra breve]
MDRKSQIFAPVSKAGGMKRSFRPKTDVCTGKVPKDVMDSLKSKYIVVPTIFKTCSYKSENSINNFDNPKVEAILTKDKKPVCYMITGSKTSISEKEAFGAMPKDMEETLKKIQEGMDENTQ